MKIRVKQDGLILRILQYPLVKTTDATHAHNSKWTWGMQKRGGPDEKYVLTTLGILNTVTGLWVETK